MEDKIKVVNKKSLSFNSTIDVKFKVDEIKRLLNITARWMTENKIEGKPKPFWGYMVALEAHGLELSKNINIYNLDEEGKRLGFEDIFDVWRSYKLARRKRAMDFNREAVAKGPYPFLDQVINELVDAAYKYLSNIHKVVYSFVSAHNTNIYHLTTAMGFVHEVMIPFGSSLIYELHFNNSTSKFSIKVLYDGAEINIENTKFLAKFEDKFNIYKQNNNLKETPQASSDKDNEGKCLKVIFTLLVGIMICSLFLGIMGKEKEAPIELISKKRKSN